MMWVRRLVLAAFVVVILVGGWTLAQRNAALVDVDGIFYHVEGAKLWLVLVCTFAAGIVVSAFFFATPLIRARMLGRRYRKELNVLETEIHQLRTQPLSICESSAAAPSDPVREA